MPVFRSDDGDPGETPAGPKNEKDKPPASRSGDANGGGQRPGEPSSQTSRDPASAQAPEPRNRLQEQAAASPSSGGPSASSKSPEPAAAFNPAEVPASRQPESGKPWSLLGEINSSVSEAGARTENRILRGLMALDERIAGRQHSMEDALGVVLQDHARTMETIRKEIAASSDRTVERIAQLEERTYETLSTFIAVLQQIRAELSVLSDTIKSLEIETNLAKRARSGGPG